MKILVTGDRNWLITPESQRLLEETEYEPTLERRMEIGKEIQKIQQDRIDFIWSVLDRYIGSDLPPVLVEGGARGVDTIARNWAVDRKITYITYPADWNGLGKKAGPMRNQKMLDVENPDLVIAFHSNIEESKGTKHMINYAQRKSSATIILYTGTEDLDVPWETGKYINERI